MYKKDNSGEEKYESIELLKLFLLKEKITVILYFELVV